MPANQLNLPHLAIKRTQFTEISSDLNLAARLLRRGRVNLKRFAEGVALLASLASLVAYAPHALAQTQTDPVIAFAVSSDAADAGSADRLFRVNLLTGEAVMVGPLGPVGGIFEDVEGLAIDATGALFGIDDDTKTLLAISQASGRATAIGAQGGSRIPSGAAQDLSIAYTCSGTTFGAARNSKNFYRVNMQSGVFDLIGTASLSGSIQDLAFAGGNLYGLGDDGLYRIDPNTGTSALIGSYGAGINFGEGGGLAGDANGQLWAIAERRNTRGDIQPSQIYKVDRVSGLATLSASSAIGGFESLAIGAPNCALGGVIVSTIPSLNALGLLLMSLGLVLIALRKPLAR